MIIDPRQIAIRDYTYELPEIKIAQYPLSDRESSKLLVYRQGEIKKAVFKEIAQYIPDNSFLVFNNTKVVHARLLFQKETGAEIEVFCLEPVNAMPIESAFRKTGSVKWMCMIGNAKRWKEGVLLKNIKTESETIVLSAEKIEQSDNGSLINFSWTPATYSFSEILLVAGLLPLPPYLNRNVEENDEESYNTVYASHEGSVAAPTAGLHFTQELISSLTNKNISSSEVTLHVGAGTFKPVKAAQMEDHEMHAEQIFLTGNFLKDLKKALDEKSVIPVGTTSMRTLESLYWFGLKLILDQKKTQRFEVFQWEPYQYNNEKLVPPESALQAVIDFYERSGEEYLTGSTQIIIAPGYEFKIANALITNFHQPGSTLLLLVAALLGEDWRIVYDYALKNDFRFLSYGDSSLLIPSKLIG